MKAIVVNNPGGSDQLALGDLTKPEPGREEILIRVAYAGLNRADLLQRMGKYPAPAGASEIMGLEVSGEVIAVGENVESIQSGDWVCALTSGGGYAEFCVAHQGQCFVLPKQRRKSLSLQDAACLPEALFTVWGNVFERGGLNRGETCLIHGGTSGIGSIAIQAAAKLGAQVIATAGTAEKCKLCLDLGAAFAIHYREEDFVARVKELTDGRGVDVILDMVGGLYLARNIESLALEGRLVFIATQGGSVAEVDLRKILFKRLILTGSTLRAQSDAQKEKIGNEIRKHLWPLVLAGEIQPICDSVHDVSKEGVRAVAQAHERMESHSHTGKILLKWS